MYRILLIITITIFSFLILVFYPNHGSDTNFDNIIYLQPQKFENMKSLLYVTVDNNVSNENNEISDVDVDFYSDYIWPLDFGVGEISSVLGHREGSLHRGWDISTLGVTRPLYSVADGVVIRTGISGSLTSGFGYICCVQYTDSQLGDFMIIYPHLMKATELKVGDKVKKGDIIGYTGTTGNSTGIHLHFQMAPVNNYNNYYNPLRLLYGMEMTRSGIESHFGLKFQANAMNSNTDQRLNIENGVDTLLKDGWLK